MWAIIVNNKIMELTNDPDKADFWRTERKPVRWLSEATDPDGEAAREREKSRIPAWKVGDNLFSWELEGFPTKEAQNDFRAKISNDYELTESQLNDLAGLDHALTAIVGCLERLTNDVNRTYQKNRPQELLIIMHAINDSRMRLREVKTTLENWEPTVFDECTGRKVIPKPTRPKYPR